MRPGNVSLLHKHRKFTELYYILRGKGTMLVGGKKFIVSEDMLVEIKPGIPHKLVNSGKKYLKHLVISTPSFDPKDVFLIKEK